MTIAKNWKDSSGKRVISVVDDLSFNKYQPDGVFATYEYTPQTGYFAAVGTTPERRMSKEATILTIQATMPANKAGTYTLGAEFIAALDGSGDVYTGKVVTNAVTVSGDSKAPAVDDTPVITETNADTLAQGNDAANTPAGTDGAANGSTAADGTADTPAGTALNAERTGHSPVLFHKPPPLPFRAGFHTHRPMVLLRKKFAGEEGRPVPAEYVSHFFHTAKSGRQTPSAFFFP